MVRDWDSEFEAMGGRWIEDAYPKPSQVPPILYHYTDAAGLAGMLRSGRIWSTDYRFLNDESEVAYYTRNVTRPLIEERKKSSVDNLKLKLYDEIIYYENAHGSDDLFVFSLSSERDDLSQWRGYARDGLGFTVGLQGRKVAEGANKYDQFAFSKVEYDPVAQMKFLGRALDEFEIEVTSSCAAYPDDVDTIIRDAANNFAWCAWNRAVYNKHKSFQSEGEWRMVFYVAERNKAKQTKTRVSGQRLVNFTEVPIGTDGRLPIVAIGIGPGFKGPEQKLAVQALCRETGYDPDIYPADTPYRRV